MWPFVAASGITFYLVSKAQDMGVRCVYAFHVPHRCLLTRFAAEAYKNDPRNPYREEIAKEEAAAHH